MKRKILIGALLFMLIFTTGCFQYGTGKSIGYVTTVDNAFFYDKAWIKTTPESSDADCYLIPKNSKESDDLRELAKSNERAEFTYNRHLVTAAFECYDDVIKEYEVLE